MSKLTDSDGEAHETEHWLACAVQHGYISSEEFGQLRARLAEIGRMLGGMIAEPWKFLPKPRKVRPNPPD